MPQLNKGGKYVFGLSAISNRREILFPAETLEQYPVQKESIFHLRHSFRHSRYKFSRGAKSRADFA